MKEFLFGNTVVILHSKLASMTIEEQKEWYKLEWENNSSILKALVDVVVSCHQDELPLDQG